VEERPYNEIIDETCPSCRQGIPLGSKVCPECGYRIRPEEVPEVERPPLTPRATAPSSGFSRPGLGGALIILSGLLALLTGIYTAVEPGYIMEMFSDLDLPIEEGVVVASGILTMIFGIIAMSGGYFAIRRRHWGLAIVGAILGMLASGVLGLGFILGLIGLILVAISRRDFA